MFVNPTFVLVQLRDLHIYVASLGRDLFYYRDKNSLECDAIIHLFDGRWSAIEIKLGTDEAALDKAATGLFKLKEKITKNGKTEYW